MLSSDFDSEEPKDKEALTSLLSALLKEIQISQEVQIQIKNKSI